MNETRDPFFFSARLVRLLPGWRANSLIFGLLIAIVLTYFAWQVRGTQTTFLTYAREHARMLAGVIEQNARGALLSQTSVEEILDLFLGNMARFVDYLDEVEPFSGDELSAFSQENGLAGIYIRRGDGSTAMGPSEWMDQSDALCEKDAPVLRHLSSRHLYVSIWQRTSESACIGVGIQAVTIEELQKKVGLDRLLTTLTDLPGIRYVRLEKPDENRGGADPVDPEQVVFLDDEGGKVAEVKRLFGEQVLLVGMDAGQLDTRVRQIWGEFFLFSAVLAGQGGSSPGC